MCNKCVKGFDHHCLWLNNCIGARNYRRFIALCCVYLVHGLFTLGLAISVHHLDSDASDKNIHQARSALSIVFIVIESLKSLLVGLLLLWHLHLARLGMTTYQYLVEKEQIEKLK